MLRLRQRFVVNACCAVYNKPWQTDQQTRSRHQVRRLQDYQRMANTKQVIKSCIAADVPLMLWGPPGCGKSSMVRAACDDAGAHIETLIGSTLDPVDVGGYLVPAGDRVISHAPPWVRRLSESTRPTRVLFLDELSCAPATVQASLLRVICERQAGDVSLDGVAIIAASNPADQAADGGVLSAAMANRFAHHTVEPNAKEWVAGTLSGWGRGMSAALARPAGQVAAFIAAKPSLLSAPPKDSARAGLAWPSPRSWTAAIRIMSAGGDASLCVGEAAAAELATFVAASDLPDPEAVLAGTAKIPARADRATATLGAVVAAAVSEHSNRPDRIDRAWKLLETVRPDAAITPAAALIEFDGQVPPFARALGQRIIDAKNNVK